MTVQKWLSLYPPQDPAHQRGRLHKGQETNIEHIFWNNYKDYYEYIHFCILWIFHRNFFKKILFQSSFEKISILKQHSNIGTCRSLGCLSLLWLLKCQLMKIKINLLESYTAFVRLTSQIQTDYSIWFLH